MQVLAHNKEGSIARDLLTAETIVLHLYGSGLPPVRSLFLPSPSLCSSIDVCEASFVFRGRFGALWRISGQSLQGREGAVVRRAANWSMSTSTLLPSGVSIPSGGTADGPREVGRNRWIGRAIAGRVESSNGLVEMEQGRVPKKDSRGDVAARQETDGEKMQEGKRRRRLEQTRILVAQAPPRGLPTPGVYVLISRWSQALELGCLSLPRYLFLLSAELLTIAKMSISRTLLSIQLLVAINCALDHKLSSSTTCTTPRASRFHP